MNLATNAYGLIALGVVGIALQMARKNTGPGQKPKDIAARIALFVVVFGFMVYAVPLMFNAGVVHVFNQTQNSAAGQIVGATLNNSAGMVQALVGGQVTLPEVDTVAPVLPDSEALPKIAPVAPIAPRREPQVRQVPQVQRATVSASNAAAPAPAAAPLGNGLGADNNDHAYVGPAVPANYAPLGTDNGKLIQGPVAPSFLDSPTIKTVLGQPEGGPSAEAANAITWTDSPTIRTISQYTVERGDTMHKIAKWWYGDGAQWVAICKANPMRDCDNLRAGMVLNLP